MGKLGINSNPQGARIYIDDKDTGEVTPHTFELEPGEYSVEPKTVINNDEHIRKESIFLKEGDVKELNIELERNVWKFRLISYPSDADIYIDGKLTDRKTPSWFCI